MSLKRDEDYDELPPPLLSKKQRMNDEDPATTFEDIDPDALDRILAFLDVASLFQFAFSSKQFRAMLTHEHVVRSGRNSGGFSSQSVSKVIDLAAKRKTIFLPSPLRLLRLANGKRCERSDCEKRVNNVRSHYGLFICSNHSAEVAKIVPFKSIRSHVNDHVNDRMCQMQHQGKVHMLRRPFTDATGERAGPIVAESELTDQDALEAAFHNADAMRPNHICDKIMQAFDQARLDRNHFEGEKNEKRK
jgi:hypothetical protein